MPFGYRDSTHSRQPGWYADAHDPTSDRWWNGVSWSDSRRPRGGGPIRSVTSPSPEAITYAAVPKQTMDTLSGNLGPPIPVMPSTGTPNGSVIPPSRRAAPRSSGRGTGAIFGLIAAVIGLWLVITGGNATFSVIGGFASLFALASARRQRSGAGALGAVVALVLSAAGILLAIAPQEYRDGLQQMISQIIDS